MCISLLLEVFDSAVSDICWLNTVKAHQVCRTETLKCADLSIFIGFLFFLFSSGPRGYVPASKLARYHQITTDPPQSPHLNVAPCGPGPRRHSYTPGAQPLLTTTTMPCFQVTDTLWLTGHKTATLLALIRVSNRTRPLEIDGRSAVSHDHQSHTLQHL